MVISACLLYGTGSVRCDVMFRWWQPTKLGRVVNHSTIVGVVGGGYFGPRTNFSAVLPLSCCDEVLQIIRLGRAFILSPEDKCSQATCVTLVSDAPEHPRQPAVQVQGN
jgi:hypothetical protein